MIENKKKIKVLEETLEELIRKNDELLVENEGLKEQLFIEQNKPKEDLKKIEKLLKDLEKQKTDYNVLLSSLKIENGKCKKSFLEFAEMKKQYKNEMDKFLKEMKKISK